ncbi:type III pantothenate kinase [Pedobacter insulae]|uniref:Type III pantothenate kinase n=1 Tax=Pedobacter insulae TaxID=414048 RepID=A0A1I2T9U3_9SPHI|nr:type III pantothenate kinase [Pedobacter insulae]SFG61665.1 type III pantothenate kinase [Pedobacter insulae]
MHNLVIDIGNTNSKLAVFNARDLVHYQRVGEIGLNDLKEILDAYPVQNFTISSVRTGVDGLVDYLKDKLNYFPFSTKINAGVINNYQTLDTLGLDRWAKIIAAHKIYAERNCLMIDAGTCITYDVLTAKSEYFGGSISPGIGMRFAAVHHYTGKLPLIKWDGAINIPAGTNTENAIKNGVLQGIVNEIAGFIAAENNKNNNLLVLLTGGDADFLMEQLKNSIFASQITVDPYLVLKGLNEVITL